MEQQIKDMLQSFARTTGRELQGDLDEVAAYIAEQGATLSAALASVQTGDAEQTDFDDALLAARDNVVLTLGVNLTRRSDVVDQRTVGFVQGLISVAIAAL